MGAAKAGAEGGRDPDLVGSFEKGLRVLRTFDAEHPSMSLSEVAERAGLSRAAARRFLHTLVHLGYARLEDKRFSLSPRVLELGFAYLSSLGLPEVLTPALKEVSERLCESSSASVLDGLDIVYVARVQASRIMSVRLGIGARLPALHTSMGRVLLAHAPQPIRERALAAYDGAPLTEHTLTDRTVLEARLTDAQAEGYCLVDQELELGLRALAVPVRDRSGRVVAAMNVSGHAARVTAERMRSEYLPVLRAAAEILQASLT